MVGKTISHYKITEKLGEGGMGVVYKAQDLKLDRFVALKFLPPHLTTSEDEKQRFIHEAKAASALQHNNICAIHEIDETDDDQIFICMDYYEGETLDKRIKEKPFPIEETIDIAIQIAQGLAKAHEKEIVHRDIKPANIMLTADGVVKILDFGLAKLSTQTKLTKESTTLGTVSYMSPEQVKGDEVDYRTDIWSLGVLIYEMLTGQFPFKGDYEQAVVYSIINEASEPLTSRRTGLPLELERIVNKALTKDKDERYQHIDEMLVDLKRLKKDSDTSITIDQSAVNKKASGSKHFRNFIIGAAAIVLVTILYIILKPILFKEPPIEPKPIVVISFKNQTGEKAYDYLQEAIPNLLITSLEQSKYLRVITWERMFDLLRQIGREDVDIIDKELGFKLCRMEGVEAIILGSFVKAGDIFATDVKVLDVQSKRLLKSASSKGEGIGSILQNQIDDLSREISSRVGISEETIGGAQLRISDITTPSMEAYNYFLRGRDDYDKFYYYDARQFLERAIQLDSTFAIAYLHLAWTNDELGDYNARDYYYQKAKLFSKKATDKERLYIDAYYARRIEKDPEKRFHILKEMAKKYPKEKRIHMDLGRYYDAQKMYDKALIEFNKALELDPDYGPVLNCLAYLYGDLENFEKSYEYLQQYTSVLPGDANPFDSMAELYLRMGKIDQAIAKYKEALEAKPGFSSAWRLGFAYGLKEDYVNALNVFDQYIATSQSPGLKARGYMWKGLFHYITGRMKQYQIDFNKGVELAKTTGFDNNIAIISMIKAWIFYETGEFELSRKHYAIWLSYQRKSQPQFRSNFEADYSYYLGLIYIKQSDNDSARLQLTRMKSLFPDLTPSALVRINIRYHYLQACILMVEDSLEKAISIFKKQPSLDMPFMFTINFFIINFPFLQDGLAQAYLKNGELDNAIATYEKLITLDPDSKNWRRFHPKYHYRLAKLYEEKGWLEKAIKEYVKFLEIWKDADKDLPELIDAKKRLTALQARAVK
jgi:tetratricopeptide (TPR) repeat protein